jgi:hypothetical protein
MRPRYEVVSFEAQDLLRKALQLEKRMEEIEVKKGDHHKSQTFGTEPENAQFMIETGGQTYNAFYNTNQNLLESADIANKGATSESINLDAMPMNERGNQKGRLVEG